LGPKRCAKLEALALGWKTRRIFKLSETASKAMLVKDHDKGKLWEVIGQEQFIVSRNNSVIKFTSFIK